VEEKLTRKSVGWRTTRGGEAREEDDDHGITHSP
jgi:hypothetical protein